VAVTAVGCKEGILTRSQMRVKCRGAQFLPDTCVNRTEDQPLFEQIQQVHLEGSDSNGRTQDCRRIYTLIPGPLLVREHLLKWPWVGLPGPRAVVKKQDLKR
jgi:hypothetical protein